MLVYMCEISYIPCAQEVIRTSIAQVRTVISYNKHNFEMC